MTRKMMAGGAVALVLAGGAIAGGRLLATGSGEVRALVEAHDPAPPALDELRRLLLSAEFRDRLAARTQLGRLPAAERAGVVVALAAESDPAVRLIAIGATAGIEAQPDVRAMLEALAGADPDPDVREAASRALGGPG